MAQPMRTLQDFGFNPMQTAMPLLQLEALQQHRDVQERQQRAAHIEQLLTKGEVSDQDFVTLQNELWSLNGMGQSINPDQAYDATLAGRELYRSVAGFREEHPDAPLPTEIKGMLKGYVQRFGVLGQRLAQPALRTEREATVRRAFKGDVDAMASLAVDNPELQKTVIGKELVSPVDQARIAQMEKQNQQIDANVAKLQEQTTAIIGQNALTERKIREFDDFREPMNTLYLVQQQGKNEQLQTELQIQGAKNQAVKQFWDSLPQRREQVGQQAKAAHTALDQLTEMKSLLDVNAISPQDAAAQLQPLGIPLEQLDQRLVQAMAQVEDLDREQQWLNAPTMENFQAFQQGLTLRRQALLQRGAQLKQQKESLTAQVGRERLGFAREKYTTEQDYQKRLRAAQQELAEAGTPAQAAAIARKHDVAVTDITPALKDPNKPNIEIKMPGTTEEAGKFSMIKNALQNVDDVMTAITNPDGTVNRDLVFESFVNLPFSEGREINSMIEDAISAKLRAETGAAANAEEVKSITKRFGLNSFDKDSVILSKLNRLRRFLSDTIMIRDPSGKLREAANPSGRAPAPKVGTTEGGYRFKGGDPGNPKNWEKLK